MAKPGKANQMSDDRIADLVTRLRSHAMDRSNLYTALTREAADALDAAVKERDEARKKVCEFGCGPSGEEYVEPGFGLVPMCPVHGWMCNVLDNAAAQIVAAEADAERLAEALKRIANAEHQFHPVGGYIYPNKIEKWARDALAVHATRNEDDQS